MSQENVHRHDFYEMANWFSRFFYFQIIAEFPNPLDISHTNMPTGKV